MDDLLTLCDQEELAATSDQGAGGAASQAVPARRSVRYTLIESSSSEASPEVPPEAQDVPAPTVEMDVV